jgi:hypothetical protein
MRRLTATLTLVIALTAVSAPSTPALANQEVNAIDPQPVLKAKPRPKPQTTAIRIVKSVDKTSPN